MYSLEEMDNIIISFIIGLSIYFYTSFKIKFIKISFLLFIFLILYLSFIKNIIYYKNFIVVIFSLAILLFIFSNFNVSSAIVKASRKINLAIISPLLVLFIFFLMTPDLGLYWQVIEKKFVIFVFDPNESFGSRLIFDSFSINILIYFFIFSLFLYFIYIIKFYDNNLISSLIITFYLISIFYFISITNFLSYLIMLEISFIILLFITVLQKNLFIYNNFLFTYFILIFFLLIQNNIVLVKYFNILNNLIIIFFIIEIC